MTDETKKRLIGENVHYYRRMARKGSVEENVPGFGDNYYGPWAAIITGHAKDGSQRLAVWASGEQRPYLETGSYWDGKGERPEEYWIFREPISKMNDDGSSAL